MVLIAILVWVFLLILVQDKWTRITLWSIIGDVLLQFRWILDWFSILFDDDKRLLLLSLIPTKGMGDGGKPVSRRLVRTDCREWEFTGGDFDVITFCEDINLTPKERIDSRTLQLHPTPTVKAGPSRASGIERNTYP